VTEAVRCPSSGAPTKTAALGGEPPNVRVKCPTCGTTFSLEDVTSLRNSFPQHFLQKGEKVEKLYAFVALDPDGNEGVMAFMDDQKRWIPMIGANRETIDQYRPVVKVLAESMMAGIKVKLVSFSGREDVEVIRG